MRLDTLTSPKRVDSNRAYFFSEHDSMSPREFRPSRPEPRLVRSTRSRPVLRYPGSDLVEPSRRSLRSLRSSSIDQRRKHSAPRLESLRALTLRRHFSEKYFSEFFSRLQIFFQKRLCRISWRHVSALTFVQSLSTRVVSSRLRQDSTTLRLKLFATSPQFFSSTRESFGLAHLKKKFSDRGRVTPRLNFFRRACL
jgi:hypothetical protein